MMCRYAGYPVLGDIWITSMPVAMTYAACLCRSCSTLLECAKLRDATLEQLSCTGRLVFANHNIQQHTTRELCC
jgi:hypothetical protein